MKATLVICICVLLTVVGGRKIDKERNSGVRRSMRKMEPGMNKELLRIINREVDMRPHRGGKRGPGMVCRTQCTNTCVPVGACKAECLGKCGSTRIPKLCSKNCIMNECPISVCIQCIKKCFNEIQVCREKSCPSECPSRLKGKQAMRLPACRKCMVKNCREVLEKMLGPKPSEGSKEKESAAAKKEPTGIKANNDKKNSTGIRNETERGSDKLDGKNLNGNELNKQPNNASKEDGNQAGRDDEDDDVDDDK
uniref:Vanadium-binding protein 2 n=1 Tax=Ciona intestinalis TaxID=7719 RepID=A7VMU7_CIOIN|nr:vanadium-binding protein 2 precursor [Ciona intestinalis]BAF76317.1 vanadium-binding protein 2 [Ciona intestinalis]|eukprot:NP_001122353.1 vanadium-binding protein 2 precursor [Ciona intestinalis]